MDWLDRLLWQPGPVLGGLMLLLYLLDCARLQAPEVLLGEQRRDGRLKRLVGAGRATIVAGRILYWLPPAAPWRALRSLSTRPDLPAPPPPPAAPAIATATIAAAMLSAVLALLFGPPHGLVVLASLATIYLGGLALAALIVRRVPGTSAWRMLEGIACPPHALNLYRKALLSQGPFDLAHAVGGITHAAARDRSEEGVRELMGLLDEPTRMAIEAALQRSLTAEARIREP